MTPVKAVWKLIASFQLDKAAISPKHPDLMQGTLRNLSLNLSQDQGLNPCPRQRSLKSLDLGLPGYDPDILLDEDVINWPEGDVTIIFAIPQIRPTMVYFQVSSTGPPYKF